ncbi:hypothetical protein GXW82_44215 [Streptacidiphilus sp. 4-A2]|nr:hypothetical protein [Streptacidiphilus sp. 4-A2]
MIGNNPITTSTKINYNVWYYAVLTVAGTARPCTWTAPPSTAPHCPVPSAILDMSYTTVAPATQGLHLAVGTDCRR